MLHIPDLEIEGLTALCFTMMARTREENKSQKHTLSRNSIIPHCSTRNLSDSSGGLYSIYLAIIPAGTWLSLYMCIVYTFINERMYIEAICSIRFIIRDAYLRRSNSPLTHSFSFNPFQYVSTTAAAVWIFGSNRIIIKLYPFKCTRGYYILCRKSSRTVGLLLIIFTSMFTHIFRACLSVVFIHFRCILIFCPMNNFISLVILFFCLLFHRGRILYVYDIYSFQLYNMHPTILHQFNRAVLNIAIAMILNHYNTYSELKFKKSAEVY